MSREGGDVSLHMQGKVSAKGQRSQRGTIDQRDEVMSHGPSGGAVHTVQSMMDGGSPQTLREIMYRT